jgi:hypothetical protein
LGYLSQYSRQRSSYKVRKPEGKRPLGRLRHSLEDNIKMDLTEIGCEGVGWICLAEGRALWWALGNAIRTLGFHKMLKIS